MLGCRSEGLVTLSAKRNMFITPQQNQAHMRNITFQLRARGVKTLCDDERKKTQEQQIIG